MLLENVCMISGWFSAGRCTCSLLGCFWWGEKSMLTEKHQHNCMESNTTSGIMYLDAKNAGHTNTCIIINGKVYITSFSWWRHHMETFSALLAVCAGNSPVPGEFPSQRPVTQSFDVFFDLHLNKRLSKQSWGWWFETPLRPLWRHCNVIQLVSSWCQAVIDYFARH